jgi:hypothetical protein
MGDAVPVTGQDLFLGPFLHTLYQTGVELSRGNLKEAVKAISPGVGNILVAIAGETRGNRQRVGTAYEGASERLIKAMGFTPVEEAVERDKTGIIRYRERQQREEEQEAIDTFIRAKTGKEKTKAAKRLQQLGISSKRVAEERKRKERKALQRTWENVPKKERKQYKTVQEFR